MQDYEIDAYLGDTQVTADQRQRITAAAQAVAARYPHPDLADDRERALSAAVQVILGDTDPDVIAATWHEARRVERDAHAALTGALIAVAPGVPETTLAARFRVRRMTVRKALGKG